MSPLARRSAVLALAASCAASLAHAAVTPIPRAPAPALERPAANEQREWANELELDFEAELNGGLEAELSGELLVERPASSSSESSFSMPQPFDQILSTNFTSSTCPVFFQNFLHDSEFTACTNMWLLLQTSTEFFQLERTSANTSMEPVLDNACSPDPGPDVCAGVMGRYAAAMQKQNLCGKDLAAQNPLAVTALQGFRSYALMREATCVKDDATGEYCFANAVMDVSPMNAYLYQLPAGTGLPSNYQATCDTCSASLLGIYSDYASNSSLAISRTYDDARSVLALSCGPTFSPRVATSSNHANSGLASNLVRAGPLSALLGASLLYLFW